MKNKEITIIGAGSTGLSAGVFLNDLGYKPRILEKRDRAKITKAVAVNPVTLQLFEKTGITDRFIKNGWKLGCMNFWYNDELVYKNHFSKVKHPYPFTVVLPQYQTEQILEDYLNEKGIDVERNWELLSLSSLNNSVNLEFKNVGNKNHFSMQTDGIVIGADGSKSKVRQEIGTDLSGWEHPNRIPNV